MATARGSDITVPTDSTGDTLTGVNIITGADSLPPSANHSP